MAIIPHDYDTLCASVTTLCLHNIWKEKQECLSDHSKLKNTESVFEEIEQGDF